MMEERVLRGAREFLEEDFFLPCSQTYKLEEKSDSGRTELIVEVEGDNLCSEDYDNKGKCNFLREKSKYRLRRSVDHVLLQKKDEKWNLYFIEMKSQVDNKKWQEIREKIRASYFNFCALERVLGIHIEAVKVYITYELTIEKMKSGLSKIRNKGIAAAFSYMNVIEAWGSGIPKIFREAKEYGLREPELIDMGSDFRINLYRKDAAVDANGVIDPKSVANSRTSDETDATKTATNETGFGTVGTVGTDGTNSGTVGTNGTILNGLTDEEASIVKLIQAEPTVTQKKMHEETGLSLRTIKRLTSGLQEKGKLVRIGSNRSGSWLVKE